jgi:hypothetical protein
MWAAELAVDICQATTSLACHFHDRVRFCSTFSPGNAAGELTDEHLH